MRLARCEVVPNVVSACTAKDDDIEEGIGTKTVCTVDRDRGSLASGAKGRS